MCVKNSSTIKYYAVKRVKIKQFLIAKKDANTRKYCAFFRLEEHVIDENGDSGKTANCNRCDNREVSECVHQVIPTICKTIIKDRIANVDNETNKHDSRGDRANHCENQKQCSHDVFLSVLGLTNSFFYVKYYAAKHIKIKWFLIAKRKGQTT